MTYLWCFYFVFFFFSSRRRHTRCSRDWSSDVCSSDLYRASCRRTGACRRSASQALYHRRARHSERPREMRRATQAGRHTGVEGGASAGDTALAHRTLLHDWVMGHVASVFSARVATPRCPWLPSQRLLLVLVESRDDARRKLGDPPHPRFPARDGPWPIERKEVAAPQR